MPPEASVDYGFVLLLNASSGVQLRCFKDDVVQRLLPPLLHFIVYMSSLSAPIAGDWKTSRARTFKILKLIYANGIWACNVHFVYVCGNLLFPDAHEFRRKFNIQHIFMQSRRRRRRPEKRTTFDREFVWETVCSVCCCGNIRDDLNCVRVESKRLYVIQLGCIWRFPQLEILNAWLNEINRFTFVWCGMGKLNV